MLILRTLRLWSKFEFIEHGLTLFPVESYGAEETAIADVKLETWRIRIPRGIILLLHFSIIITVIIMT